MSTATNACAATIFVFAAALASAGSAPLGVHTDVQIAVEDGKMVTGVRDFSDPQNPVITMGVRVYGAQLGEQSIPHFTDDPGYNAQAGTFPAPSTRMGFNFLDALRKWDPVNQNFDTIPPETLFVGLGATNATSPTGDGEFKPGFLFATSNSGGFHQHINYFLNSPSSDGVYMLTIELYVDDASIDNTDPIYILFNEGDPDDNGFDDAFAHAEALAEPPCEGDVDGNGAIEIADISFIIFRLGDSGTPGEVEGDADGSGAVEAADISYVIFRLGSC